MEITTNHLKKISYILVALVIFSLIIWESFFNTQQKRYVNSLKNIMDEEYSGIVINRYVDKNNHNSPKLIFSNNTETAIFGEFFGIIQIGDSIVKKKGDSKIIVYRGKEKVILDNKEVLNKWFKNK